MGIDPEVNDGLQRLAASRRLLGPWWLIGLLGLSSVVLGVMALVWPDRTVLVLVVLLAIHLILFGTIRFGWALTDPLMPHRGFVALMGILGILAGLLTLRRPFRTLAILVLVLGLYWLFSGLVDVFTAITERNQPNRGLLAGLGALSAVAGLVVLLWPSITALAVAIVAGVYLVLAGAGQLLLATGLQKLDTATEAVTPQTHRVPADQPTTKGTTES